jgi:ribose transport system permease protein
MTFVILLGGIDLSVGSTMAFAGLTAVYLLQATGQFFAAVSGALGAGLAVGLVNGGLITYARLPPFIVTLGTMSVVRGLAYLYTSRNWGEPLYVDAGQTAFRAIADYQVPALAVAFVLCGFLLRSTRFGHYVYAIGGNREAARFTGLPIEAVEISAYALAGALAGAAG